MSDRIRKFMGKKTDKLISLADEQEKTKDKKVENLVKEREDIHKKRQDHEGHIERI